MLGSCCTNVSGCVGLCQGAHETVQSSSCRGPVHATLDARSGLYHRRRLCDTSGAVVQVRQSAASAGSRSWRRPAAGRGFRSSYTCTGAEHAAAADGDARACGRVECACVKMMSLHGTRSGVFSYRAGTTSLVVAPWTLMLQAASSPGAHSSPQLAAPVRKRKICVSVLFGKGADAQTQYLELRHAHLHPVRVSTATCHRRSRAAAPAVCGAHTDSHKWAHCHSTCITS